MANTPSNPIPYVPENTIDPAAGLNSALNVIDVLLQLRVTSIINTPPGVAVNGQRHIVGTTPSGPWASVTPGLIARYTSPGDFWNFYPANLAVLGDVLYVNNGSNVWAPVTGGGGGGAQFTEYYESAEQVVTVAGTLSLAHGLSGTPKLVVVTYICKTTNLGYAVGDTVTVMSGMNGRVNAVDGSFGELLVPGAVNVSLRFGSSFALMSKSSGNLSGTSAASWRAIVKAWG